MLEVILGIAGLFGGSALTITYQKFSGRLQKMSCYYMQDEILSRIPQQNENGSINQNLHYKQFRLKNTTNFDIKDFKVIFQFDLGSTIQECYSKSKEGIDVQRIRKNNRSSNQAEATIKNFNRGDKIDFFFSVANVIENSYYVSESKALGFKIKCYDKRAKAIRLKSKMSDQVLVNNPQHP